MCMHDDFYDSSSMSCRPYFEMKARFNQIMEVS
jgi:hypothetical protein